MNVGEALTRKLGPLPAWGWGVAIGGTFLVWRLTHPGTAKAPVATITGGTSELVGGTQQVPGSDVPGKTGPPGPPGPVGPAGAPGTPGSAIPPAGGGTHATFGLLGWPTYARASLSAAQAYAYRIFVRYFHAPATASAGHWGLATWPAYARASQASAQAYALRVFSNGYRVSGTTGHYTLTRPQTAPVH